MVVDVVCVRKGQVIKMGEHKGYIRTADEKGSVSISDEVIAVIAASAAIEVKGVHGLYISSGRELTSLNGRKGLSKGVKLCMDGDNAVIDVQIISEMGFSVSDVGAKVQKAVISSIESAVGITVTAVNVHVCGIAHNRGKQPDTAAPKKEKQPDAAAPKKEKQSDAAASKKE